MGIHVRCLECNGELSYCGLKSENGVPTPDCAPCRARDCIRVLRKQLTDAQATLAQAECWLKIKPVSVPEEPIPQEKERPMLRVVCDGCDGEQYVSEAQPSEWFYLKKGQDVVGAFCSVKCVCCAFLTQLELYTLSHSDKDKEVTGNTDVPGAD